jgi:hypothetical protein
MSGEVLDTILPLSIRMIGRRKKYPSPALNDMRMVMVDVFHPHHHRVTALAITRSLLGKNDSAIAGVKLRTVVPNPKAQRETKGIAKPSGGGDDVRIREHGNYRTLRYTPIHKHFGSPSY